MKMTLIQKALNYSVLVYKFSLKSLIVLVSRDIYETKTDCLHKVFLNANRLTHSWYVHVLDTRNLRMAVLCSCNLPEIIFRSVVRTEKQVNGSVTRTDNIVSKYLKLHTLYNI